MMKRKVLTFTLSMVILNTFSQGFLKESKKSVNISSELGNYGIYIFPNFVIDFKKNTIAFGPTFNIYPSYNFAKKTDNVFYPTKNKFYGFHLYYQYNFRPDKKIDFFVQTNLTYEYLKLLNYKEPSSNLEISYESKTVNLSQTLGVGFKINFTERLYSSLSVDFGFNYYNKKTDTGYSGQLDVQSNRTGIIRIGFGYKL